MSDKQGEPGQVPWPQGRHQGVEPGAEQVPWRRVCLIDDDPINNLVCERLLISIFACQDVKAFLETNGAEGVGSTPEEFGELLASEVAKWAKVAKAADQ